MCVGNNSYLVGVMKTLRLNLTFIENWSVINSGHFDWFGTYTRDMSEEIHSTSAMNFPVLGDHYGWLKNKTEHTGSQCYLIFYHWSFQGYSSFYFTNAISHRP